MPNSENRQNRSFSRGYLSKKDSFYGNHVLCDATLKIKSSTGLSHLSYKAFKKQSVVNRLHFRMHLTGLDALPRTYSAAVAIEEIIDRVQSRKIRNWVCG